MIEKRGKSENTDVLIVGAGPAGLMMACQLAIHNISFRIIDKAEQKRHFSGALLIQARTMEIFHQMGMADKVLQKGKVLENIAMIHNGRRSGKIDVGNMGSGLSRFPFIFMLKQAYTIKLLAGFLEERGIKVEKGTRLEQFNQDSQSVKAVLCRPDGKKENLSSRYLIGADGIHSFVRTSLGINWEGTRDPIPLFVTDCQVKESPTAEGGANTIPGNPDTTIFFSISRKSIAGFFPLEDKNWRIDGLIPEEIARHKEISFDDATRELGGRLKMKIVVQNPDWFSVFYPNTYLASTFSAGRCFLVGDAAHVHTPIGAQGMNTGLQDSWNLAWKMAFVLKHRMSDRLLETYTSERKPVAEKLIRNTDRYFWLAIKKDFQSRFVRNFIIPWTFRLFNGMLNSKVLQGPFFQRISQTDVRYGKSTSWVGQRWPFFEWTDVSGKKIDTHGLLDCEKFVLVIFQKGNQAQQEDEATTRGIFTGSKIPVDIKQIVYSRETKTIFKKFRIRRLSYFLVRPDGYIAVQGFDTKIRSVVNYFKNYR